MTEEMVLLNGLTAWQYVELLLRILVSVICGAGIGYERSRRYKEAGIRTHIIVCVASALIMIVSKYGFLDCYYMLHMPYNADMARLAAGVVSGVSFLCAGVIFKNGNSIKGLTTAAGIFATAGIGLALGSGMYIIGIAVTAGIMLIQVLMHRFLFGPDAMITQRVKVVARKSSELREALEVFFRINDVKVVDHNIELFPDGKAILTLTVLSHIEIDPEELYNFLYDKVEIFNLNVGTMQ